jgi:hypothetical protein
VVFTTSDSLPEFLPTVALAAGRRIPLRYVATIVCMKVLELIHVTVAQAFYRWALREIDPMHPDLPRIVMKRLELADKARRMFA